MTALPGAKREASSYITVDLGIMHACGQTKEESPNERRQRLRRLQKIKTQPVVVLELFVVHERLSRRGVRVMRCTPNIQRPSGRMNLLLRCPGVYLDAWWQVLLL